MTDRYAVIGNPVAHSQSPHIHRMFADALGEDMDYGMVPVSSATSVMDSDSPSQALA